MNYFAASDTEKPFNIRGGLVLTLPFRFAGAWLAAVITPSCLWCKEGDSFLLDCDNEHGPIQVLVSPLTDGSGTAPRPPGALWRAWGSRGQIYVLLLIES